MKWVIGIKSYDRKKYLTGEYADELTDSVDEAIQYASMSQAVEALPAAVYELQKASTADDVTEMIVEKIFLNA